MECDGVTGQRVESRLVIKANALIGDLSPFSVQI